MAISLLHRCDKSFPSGHLYYRCEISSLLVMSLRYRCQFYRYRDASLLMLRYLSSIRYRCDIWFIAAISSLHRHCVAMWQFGDIATFGDIACTILPRDSTVRYRRNVAATPKLPWQATQKSVSTCRSTDTTQKFNLSPQKTADWFNAIHPTQPDKFNVLYLETRYIGPSDRLSRSCDSLIFVG